VFNATDNPSSGDSIAIYGAREHNLKNISLQIPRNRFVVITGVSGSGKSTLAFDLLFAEGQRRFLDSMNAYARQFVEQLPHPDVDLITGIPPTVSIEQRNARGGGKSTVATVTEVYHFLRLLFSRLGTLFCPDCRLPVEPQTRDQLTQSLLNTVRKRGPLTLLAPMVRNRKGYHTDVAEWAARHNYAFVRADGKLHPSQERLRLDRFREHDVEIVVGNLHRDRTNTTFTPRKLINETLDLGLGTLFALDQRGQLSTHSIQHACAHCGRSFEPLDPKHFSYNSALGWCPRCRGFGELFYLPDVDRGTRADAIEESWFDWQEGQREPCPDCQGARLNHVSRAARLQAGNATHPSLLKFLPGPATIETYGRASVDQASAYFQALRLHGRDARIARDILPEIIERLHFLRQVGLGYLQLGRGVPTLSGGEAQRIRLAAQLGSNLTGVLYVLDEPTIGLHPRDNEQLLDALDRLKKRGNSLVVVEHDEATMRRADHIIDLGPGAGAQGGNVVASGTLKNLLRHKHSITGLCLKYKKTFPTRGQRRPIPSAHPHVTLSGAALHNLKNLTVPFPLQRLVLVTGVSGSGKSTLVRECLLPALLRRLSMKRPSRHSASTSPSGHVTGGWESLRSVHEVDQSPIGRTPRSIPATYVGFFDEIRRLFAQVPEARLRGYSASRFSFNSPQGRCPECAGAGSVKLEMSFLPPAFVTCESCNGQRFSRETLDIQFRGRNVAQILELTVAEAIEFFAPFARIAKPLETLRDTGLGYLHLGQTSPTLSGGEAQRVKLVSHLLAGLTDRLSTEPALKRNLFILEEPTVGLHAADVKRLIDILHRLVDSGHSVLVIEHNLDLIAEADWIIDLGPEGGEAGGHLLVAGTPETVARHPQSHTGTFLAPLLLIPSSATSRNPLRSRRANPSLKRKFPKTRPHRFASL
jgi:excinuclease ABC subunit A